MKGFVAVMWCRNRQDIDPLLLFRSFTASVVARCRSSPNFLCIRSSNRNPPSSSICNSSRYPSFHFCIYLAPISTAMLVKKFSFSFWKCCSCSDVAELSQGISKQTSARSKGSVAGLASPSGAVVTVFRSCLCSRETTWDRYHRCGLWGEASTSVWRKVTGVLQICNACQTSTRSRPFACAVAGQALEGTW